MNPILAKLLERFIDYAKDRTVDEIHKKYGPKKAPETMHWWEVVRIILLGIAGFAFWGAIIGGCNVLVNSQRPW